MKRIFGLLLAAMVIIMLPGCNDEPDFIKNAPPASSNGNESGEDSDSGDDTTEDGVDPNFQIYLCFGQSNMEGFAKTGYDGIEEQDRTVDERFQMMAVVSDGWDREVGHWYAATPPLCRPGTGLCPADYFGRTMVEELGQNNPDIKVGVIVVAIGGAGVTAFHKTKYYDYYTQADAWQRSLMDIYSGFPYGKLVEMAKLAQKQGVIKGILMHQGETDGCGEEWRQNVADIYNSLVTDLNLNAAETPLLVGELLNDNGVGLGIYKNADLHKITEVVPNAHVVSSEGGTVAAVDVDDNGNNRGLHFSSEGYRLLGRHYAETMIALLNGQQPDEPGTSSVAVSNECFDFATLNSDLEGQNRGSWDPETGHLVTSSYGIGGWIFDTPVDFTAHRYLVVDFAEAPVGYTVLAFYSEGTSVYDYSYIHGISGTRVVFDTSGTYETSKYGVDEKKTLDLKSIKMFGIQTGGDATGVKIKRIYVMDDYPEEEPASIEDLLSFKEGVFNPRLSGATAEFDYETREVTKIGAWNVCGWELSSSVDLKGKGYLVAKFSNVGTEKPWLLIGNSNVWGEAYQASAATQSGDYWYSVIDLSEDIPSNVNSSVGTIYLDKITLIGIQAGGAEGTVSYKIEDVYVSDTNPLAQ